MLGVGPGSPDLGTIRQSSQGTGRMAKGLEVGQALIQSRCWLHPHSLVPTPWPIPQGTQIHSDPQGQED